MHLQAQTPVVEKLRPALLAGSEWYESGSQKEDCPFPVRTSKKVGGGAGSGRGSATMQVSPEILYKMLTDGPPNPVAEAMRQLTADDLDRGLGLLVWIAVYLHAYCLRPACGRTGCLGVSL